MHSRSELGERVGNELGYSGFSVRASGKSRPERTNLADVSRGQFEGLRDELGTNPERAPDFGPSKIHTTAGAIAIGARPFLVAYNVYLGRASNLALAKAIAKQVRESSGGFKSVKGLGMEVDGQAQVSMNLVDTEQTPLHMVFDFISEKAREAGVEVTWSELIGLVPERVLFEASKNHLKLEQFTPDQVLERQVARAMRASVSLPESSAPSANPTPKAPTDFLAAIASSDPVPGGGSVAAYAGALSAALIRMVTGLTIGKKKYAAVEPEMTIVASNADALTASLAALVERDADAYAAVSEAYKLPKDSADRIERIDKALLFAAKVPLETARLCAQAAELAAAVAAKGNTNAVTDAGVAALLADAGCRGAVYNVRVNVSSLMIGHSVRISSVRGWISLLRPPVFLLRRRRSSTSLSRELGRTEELRKSLITDYTDEYGIHGNDIRAPMPSRTVIRVQDSSCVFFTKKNLNQHRRIVSE